MASDNQKKYGNSRNLWRKIYPVGSPRREPQQITIVDSLTNATFSLDLQKTVRHRDYFQVVNSQSFFAEVTQSVVVVLGEYDEGLVSFNTETSKSFNFNFTFSGLPVVVFTMEGEAAAVSNTKNINIHGIATAGSGGFSSGIVGLSAPFSGTIRYRAAYASSYPSYFTSSFAPSSGTFRASAGTNIPSNVSAYTASFAALSNAPTIFLQTPFDSSVPTYAADVALSLNAVSLTTTEATSEISAPISTPIGFIAYE